MPEWLGALEGYYGPALGHDKRLSLMQWMATKGFNVFAYAPKDDPFHRAQWRDPYPDERLREFEELARRGREVGVEFCFTISPGLDWRAGEDEAVLVGKLRSIAGTGCSTFGVLWDDVPPGGAELGESHARGTAAAVDAIGGARWWTVCTDYALTRPTPYLDGFCKTLPVGVAVSWTGPAVTPLRITGDDARTLGDALGRELLLWENFPVNDALMRDVLHLGPYPERSPDLVDATQGVFLNTMEHALASRVGLACGARFWTDPASDREKVWREVIAEAPGLEPLARACRSWASDTGPDPELIEWAKAAPDDKRLRSFLEAGCRDGLDPELASEVEPWLAAWETEAQAMLMALDILERGYRSANRGIGGALLWTNARRLEKQVFGIRNTVYPVTEQTGEYTTSRPEAAAFGENLTDMLCRRALRDE
ncbi:MAG TPA: beta-N-acetylglucosaminidase domain-containing protein [Actinomycetota bacterium]|jgi:hyaluronoglucosaminidase|nr:beta-N-acetylglucosaminidase domain-containing protein [Actinomycetota bacterium]